MPWCHKHERHDPQLITRLLDDGHRTAVARHDAVHDEATLHKLTKSASAPYHIDERCGHSIDHMSIQRVGLRRKDASAHLQNMRTQPI